MRVWRTSENDKSFLDKGEVRTRLAQIDFAQELAVRRCAHTSISLTLCEQASLRTKDVDAISAASVDVACALTDQSLPHSLTNFQRHRIPLMSTLIPSGAPLAMYANRRGLASCSVPSPAISTSYS